MVRDSRLKRYEERKALVRIAVTLLLIILLGVATIKYLPQLILGITSINSKIETKTSQDNNENGDNIAPFPPKINPLPKATASETIDISGSSEANSIIKLYLNDTETKNTQTDENGTFIFKKITLSKGDNTLYTQAIDSAGNTSQKSKAETITFKTEGPLLEVQNETDQENGLVKITGTTDQDVIVTVNGRRAIVSRNGTFTIEFKLNEGENNFQLEAEDAAGNITKNEFSVSYSPE